jgi:antitoxin component of RelBE/YafQ-DinJ toxin-antitoxin module
MGDKNPRNETTLRFRATNKMKEWLMAEAERLGEDMSHVIRVALREYGERHNGNDKGRAQ